MTWSDYKGPAPVSKAAKPVAVSCSKAGGRFGQTLRVIIHPELLEGGLAWWTIGARVHVQLGAGDHQGMVRLTPAVAGKSGLTLRANIGKGGIPVLVLRGGLQSLPAKAMPAELVDHEHHPDWVELTLPAWARPPAAATPIAAAPATPASTKPRGEPFVGLGSTGHTETFAGRRGSSPIPLDPSTGARRHG